MFLGLIKKKNITFINILNEYNIIMINSIRVQIKVK